MEVEITHGNQGQTHVNDAEEPLSENEATLLSLFNVTGLGIAQADPITGRFLQVNTSFCAVTGYSETELLALSVDDLNHPEDRQREHAHFEELMRGVPPDGHEEKRYVRKDGSIIWVETTCNMISDAAGQPLRVAIMIQDVTARRETAANLEHTRARLEALAEATRVLIEAGPNPDSVLSAVARQAAALIGDLAVVRLLSADGCWLEPTAVDHPDPAARDAAAMALARERHPIDEGATGAAFSTGQPQRLTEEALSVEKHEAAPHLWPPLPAVPTAVLLAVPLRAQGRVIGTLSVSRAAADPAYDAADEDFLQNLADRAGLAIERARLFAQVRANEERLRLATEANRMVTWEWDPVVDRMMTSDNVLAIYGVPAFTGIADSMALLWPEDLPAHQEKVAHVAHEGGEYRSQFRITRPSDGQTVWLEERATALRDGAGRVARVVGIVTDITERMQAEAQLREEREALETINHIGRLLTAELDLDALVQAVTESATTLTGAHFGAFFYNALDERGEYYTLYVIAGVPRAAFAQFPLPRNTALFGPTFRGEGIVRIADVRVDPRFGHNPPYHGMPPGHLPVVSYLAVPVMGRNDDVLGGLFFGHPAVGVFDERAERLAVGLAAQAAIAVENARLFQQAQDELNARRQVETAKVAFLDAVAHDLGNALMALKGQAQLLRRRANQGRADSEALETGLTAIDVTVERASRLIHELTDVARLEAQHPLELKCHRTDLVTLARTSIDECQAAAPAHTLHLEAKVKELVGYWDADRVMRVLENLLANAVKYSPAGSTIEVQVARHEDTNGALALLTVSDEGVGIPAVDLPFIFERFRRGRNVEGRIVGTGLGLWGSQQIVAQHGGTIDIKSVEGQGTMVTVRLPLEPRQEMLNETQPVASTASLTHAVN